MDKQATVLANGIGTFWEQIVNWYQNSFISDILSYIFEQYYSVEFRAYESFSFGPRANETAQTLIMALAFGFIIAAIVIAYTRTRLGSFVRALLKNGCLSSGTAMTLYELGYFRNSTIRRELARGVTLRKIVFKADEEAPVEENDENADEIAAEAPLDAANQGATVKAASPANERFQFLRKGSQVDFITTRFYIPEDMKYRAELRFERKGSGWLPVLLTVFGSLIGAALVCHFLPDFIGLLDQLIVLTAP
ncbi:MAG: hypothetical protein IJX80_00440 [Clostridia bacterium]|nr:hypothetical protein [Clostridia bacterium]